MDNRCENIQNRLADDILGILGADDCGDVNKHVNQCPNCRRYKQALEEENRVLMEFGENVKETMKARQDKVIHALNNASQMTYKQKLPLWRIIMKNNKTKFAAAVLLIAVLVGISRVGGARAAFAQTTRFVRTTLAGLRAFVSDMRSREPVGYIDESKLPPAKSVRQVPDVQGTIISAKIKELAVVREQNVLQDFFKSENVEWIQSENNANMWYARLDHIKTERFTDFASTCEDLQLKSSPRLMLLEGQEGTIGSLSAQGEDAVALALVATVLEDDKGIELSLSFLRGHSGFEIPSLRIEIDEAVLFRLVKTTDTKESENDGSDADTENVIYVLLQIEVRSPT